MPHALFLGSSLACVDRLDMQPLAPEPESYYEKKMKTIRISHKLPSLFRRRVAQGEREDEGEYELDQMNRPIASSSNARGQPGSSAVEGEGCNVESERDMFKEIALVESGDSQRTAEAAYEDAVKRYEAEMKSFDRIKWVDIHLKHATVSSHLLSTILARAVYIQRSYKREDEQS
jgi:metal iron transporter